MPSSFGTPAGDHQVKYQIARLIERGRYSVSTGVGVVLTDRTVREPDVTRFRPEYQLNLRGSFLPADTVDLVVEVISAESEIRDRMIKPPEYATAGIPEFWLVEAGQFGEQTHHAVHDLFAGPDAVQTAYPALRSSSLARRIRSRARSSYQASAARLSIAAA